ncbi:MAG: mechanosensitive ion channel [Phycisphaerales bacterium]|nr:mechanosensitive ion channel [Phycisphaerales bacterium]
MPIDLSNRPTGAPGRAGIARSRTRRHGVALPRRWLGLAAVIVALVPGVALAQRSFVPTGPAEAAVPQTQPAPTVTVTAEDLAAARTALANNTTLTDVQREQATAALNAVQEALAERERLTTRATQSRQEIDGADATLRQNLATLAAPAVDPATLVPENLTVADLDSRLSQARAALEAARNLVTSLEAEPATRQRRREAIPGELAAAQQAQEDAETAAAAAPPDATPPELAQATSLSARAAAELAAARIRALQLELASLDARRELLQTRTDLARRQVAESDSLVRVIEARLITARAAEAQAQADAARRALLAAAGSDSAVVEVLQQTQAFTQRKAGDEDEPGVEALAAQASSSLAAARTSLQALSANYRTTFDQVRAIGLTNDMGRLLREKRRLLDSPEDLESRIRLDRERRSTALLDLFELRPLNADWGDPANRAREIASGREDLSDAQRAALEEQLRTAMNARQAAHRQLVDLLEQYQQDLGRLNDINAIRLGVLREFAGEIDRTILWVPSHHAVSVADAREIADGFAWLASPSAWRAAIEGPGGLREDAQAAPVSTFGPLLAILLIALFVRPQLARWTNLIHDKARKVATDRFSLTVRALLLATIIAGVMPAILLALANVLISAGDAADQPRAIGAGLQTAAYVLFALTFTRRLTRKGGLAEVHFRWPQAVNLAFRAQITLLAPVALATIPLLTAVTQETTTPGGPALARVGLVVWLLALSFALQRLLRPAGPVVQHVLRNNKDTWIERTRWIWYLTAVISPLVLVAITLLGYVETVRELQDRFLATIALVLALVIAAAMVTRWLTLARRKVAMEQARRRREALAAEHAKQLGASPQSPTPPAGPTRDNTLEAIDTQTRQLLRFGVGLASVLGVYWLWVGVLPALGMLDRVHLWPGPRIVESTERARPWLDRAAAINTAGAAATPAGTTAPTNGTGAQQPAPPTAAATPTPTPTPALPITSPTPPASSPAATAAPPEAPPPADAFTLADLLAAIVLAFATVVAARNIPGVVEIVLLQRLPVDKGARYAISTVVRYAIFIFGGWITLTTIGLEWGSIQWLAAALTFGLGFGLQEIFANFVSGLIILAERPFRIGDTVTVDQTSGMVTRIQMRATTVMDWDRRELIVPNRAFITGSVTNWTLSDASTRVIVPVGVAYGTDPVVVRNALLAAGKSSQFLASGTEPVALFRDFGASSLNFELRMFIRHVDNLVVARDEVLRAIEREFRAAGINIPFNQLDVHIQPPPGTTPPSGGSLPDAVANAKANGASKPSDKPASEPSASP